MRINRLLLSALVFSLLVWTSCSGEHNNTIDNVATAENVYRLVISSSPPLIIDVRTTLEYRNGSLKGALHIPVQDFATDAYKKKLENISKDRQLLVFCRTGMRSDYAMGVLRKDGYSSVINLHGGFLEWKKSGFPVIIPPST